MRVAQRGRVSWQKLAGFGGSECTKVHRNWLAPRLRQYDPTAVESTKVYTFRGEAPLGAHHPIGA